MPIAIVLGCLFIGGAVVWNGMHPASVTTGTQTQPQGQNVNTWLSQITSSINGIDDTKVKAAVAANKAAYDAAIANDKTEAGTIGIQATPSFLIGTQMVAGAYPEADFETVINAALAGKTAPTAGDGKMVTIVKANSNSFATDGDPFIGSANAPLTIDEWTDYQCPFCKQFEGASLPQILQTYVNTGKVKIVFKDFAFLGPVSSVEAEYARAVYALYPTQYFAWRTAIFSQQPQENTMTIQ